MVHPANGAMLVVLTFLVIALAVGTAAGSTAGEERQGRQIYRALEDGDRNCDDLSPRDLELVGDYVMGRMLGASSAHERMDALMEEMMGASATDRMHVAMGERFTRCGSGRVPGGLGGMMGMLGMMGGLWDVPRGSMLGGLLDEGGLGGNEAASSSGGDEAFGAAGWVMVAMMGALLTMAALGLWRFRPARTGSASALDSLNQRYARGELETEDYERRKAALRGESR